MLTKLKLKKYFQVSVQIMCATLKVGNPTLISLRCIELFVCSRSNTEITVARRSTEQSRRSKNPARRPFDVHVDTFSSCSLGPGINMDGQKSRSNRIFLFFSFLFI